MENIKSMKSIQMSFNESDIYAGVFDSLNVDSPPLPSKKALPRAPARPPYPSSYLKL